MWTPGFTWWTCLGLGAGATWLLMAFAFAIGFGLAAAWSRDDASAAQRPRVPRR